MLPTRLRIYSENDLQPTNIRDDNEMHANAAVGVVLDDCSDTATSSTPVQHHHSGNSTYHNLLRGGSSGLSRRRAAAISNTACSRRSAIAATTKWTTNMSVVALLVISNILTVVVAAENSSGFAATIGGVYYNLGGAANWTAADGNGSTAVLSLDGDSWERDVGEKRDININNISFVGDTNDAANFGVAVITEGSEVAATAPSGNVIGVDVVVEEDTDATEYIFDRTDVRVVFITLYTLVFCCCFFGNLLVILVVTLSRRLRSITNFFLANLALADFCVGLFCVMQNLSIYLIDSWVFGEFLCRMYQFVHSLSYTASIFILVVICMERYFAIVHPITCKQILTAARLRMVILTVWITAAVYSTPKFVFSKTIKNIHTEGGQEEEICVLDRKMYNSKLLDMINFGLLYVIPLLVMTVLYSKIAIALWRSSRGLSHHIHQQQQQETNSMGMHNSMYHHHQHAHHPQQHLHHHYQQPPVPGTPISGSSLSVAAGGNGAGSSNAGNLLSRKQSSKYEKQRGVCITESQVSLDADRAIVTACRKTSFYHHPLHHHHQQQQHATLSQQSSTTTGSTTTTTTTILPAPGQSSVIGGCAVPVGVGMLGGGGVGGVGGGIQSHHQRHGTQRVTHNMSHSSNNVLRARRGVVRMLIIFVLTFALCNLPYHARKMWQYWSRSYRGDSNFNALFTPLTFLVTYFNSGINPLLYAFLSRNFRKGMKELLLCSWKKGKGKSSSNSSMHHKRMALQTHSLPTDTTHIGNEQL